MSWFDAPAPLLPEIIALNGRNLIGKPALIFGDTVLDWPAFADETARVANGLISTGIRPGDRVAVVMSNRLETMIVLFGILRAGAVAVPLNVMVADRGLAAMIDDAGARAVFADGEHVDRLAPVREAGQVPHWYSVGDARWTEFAPWSAAQSSQDPAIALDDEAECNIIYSSGTTGVPKGIVHTHRRRLDWFYDLGLAMRYDRAAVNLCSLGLYSNISWAGMGCAILVGGTVVVMPGFDAADTLETIQARRVTHGAMVPVQFQRLLEHPGFDGYDVSSIKSLMCCGSPLHVALKQDIMRRLAPQLVELYGLTEGLITTLDPEDAVDRPASVGRPLMGTELKILDDDDRECPTGVPGEIVGRGRIVMAGYNNRDDANAEATWTDEHGRRWLRTGDVGKLDEAGFLYLVDRKKDLILSGGQNIYPADIEAVVIDHPAVSEVSVIGIDSDRWGETPLAVVVLKGEIDLDQLVAWTNQRVGRQQRIAGAVKVDELPRNPNGKVLKRELRSIYRGWLADKERS